MLDIRTTQIWAVSAAVLLLLAVTMPGLANINLEFREVPQQCTLVEVDLYAVSDSQDDQSLSSMEVVLAWDATALTLLGYDHSLTYPYNWLSGSGFPPSDPYGLNPNWTDGNALYMALSQLGAGNAAEATPDGLWVTRFQFAKLPDSGDVTLAMEYGGAPTETVIYSGEYPGVEVTGTLDEVSWYVWTPGDLNCDELVNTFDIDPFVLAMTDPQAYVAAYPDCDMYAADCNCDGDVNSFDIDPFVGLLTGP